MHATKLVLRDVAAAERLYEALGLKLVSRNDGGEAEVRQKQARMSVSGGASTDMLDALSKAARLIERRPHIRQYVSDRSAPVRRTVATD